MEKEQKRANILKLIKLFREREVLWNIHCSAYRRSDLKGKALEEIAKLMNMTVVGIKKKLRALRSTYIMERRKVQKSRSSVSDAENVYQPLLFWFKEMQFLDNSIIMRKPIDGFDEELDESNMIEEIKLTPEKKRKSPSSPNTKIETPDEASDTDPIKIEVYDLAKRLKEKELQIMEIEHQQKMKIMQQELHHKKIAFEADERRKQELHQIQMEMILRKDF